MFPKLIVLAAAVVAAIIAAAALAGDPPGARAGSQRDGDAQGIACIDVPGMGAMGIHYVKGDLVGDPAVTAASPEALVYEPEANGRLRLVALEYVTLKEAWDATHSSPPTLFGEMFNFTPAGNRYGLPAYYSLHAWIWEHNHHGTFAMWNPSVNCDNG
jgi:hypothetical protein